ncbi:hypothetical protein [Aestuariivivens sp. NBU2969]|uniref:hypothetical protein n=1 Tax=Aestuariivivens sp. NBU2969 TaxID=2873267 RepID=UPI001CBCFDA8|nr:hypothetical protein [Aestuariivivens sp. NBU2969]
MKSLYLIIVVSLFDLTAVSQNFNAGISAGLPKGETRDHFSYNLTAEVNYLWKISEIFEGGILTGYSYYFENETGDQAYGSMSYLAIATAGRFNLCKRFIIGLDIGGTIGISGIDINEGLYFVPKMQYNITDSIGLVIAQRLLVYDVVYGSARDVVSFGLEFRL